MDQYKFEQLMERIGNNITKDKYYYNKICALYYDTDEFIYARRALEKSIYKEKIRIRSYGVPENNSKIYINTQGDAIRSTNSEDTKKGYIVVEDSNIEIISINNSIQAVTSLLIKNSTLNLTAGKDSTKSLTSSSTSSKGLKVSNGILYKTLKNSTIITSTGSSFANRR